MHRRNFLAHTSTVLVGAFATRPRPAEYIIRGGLVYDGTGAAPILSDVAIVGDRISAIGTRVDTGSATVVDARGLAIAPGFIDIHSHTDLVLFVNNRAESKIRQGVTTEVVGQDGSSIGPWTDARLNTTRDSYAERYGVEIDFRDLAGFFARLAREPASVNVASMVGAGTVREYVIGNDDRPATATELSRMVRLVRDALAAGACGLSSGLEYVPGAFADLRELVELARPLAALGLPYASHMRNEDDQLFAAIEEALNVGRLANVPVQISHLKAQGQRNWWKAQPALDMLERAGASGIDVTFDRYPYIAYSTGLASLFPVWSRDGGTDAFLARLETPEMARRIERDVRDKIAKLGSWDAVQITSTGSDTLRWAAGEKLGALASERGMEPYALLLQLTIGDRNNAGMVGFGMSEDNTERILAHPLAMVCSDAGARAPYGPLGEGSPHPRAYGSFPRLLGHYTRDRGILTLEQAIHKITDAPARRLQLAARGRIEPGFFADIVVFDPATVRDNATFTNPHAYPDGISHVFVNGVPVIADEEHTGATPGKVARPTISQR